MLALAVRTLPVDQTDAVAADPMAAVESLVFLGLVGIIDPLRPEAIEAVRVAHRAGIDVRMITGDHLVTAQAIAAELDLGPGGMSGTDFAATADDQLAAQLPELHVFGRVSPQDKLRLVQLMQGRGDIVAMTGDAVNDAAALKQADIGVAMGSGSEVSKQAAKMILTDDNFATLVHAVELGRGIFARITAYIGYQLTQLFGLVSMFLLATILNINDGVALLPLQVLFLNFTLAIIPVIIITIDEPEPGLMDAAAPRPPGAHLQPQHRHPLDRPGASARGALTAAVGFRPRRALRGGRQRVGDDGLRRDGPGHRARRSRDAQDDRLGVRPTGRARSPARRRWGRDHHRLHRGRVPAGLPEDHGAERWAMGDLHGAGPAVRAHRRG